MSQTAPGSSNVGIMYVGHLAIGVALSSRFRDVPAWIPLVGVGLVDIINGVLVAAGIEQVRPGVTANGYLHVALDFIDWDHSLAMTLVWSVLFGLIFVRDERWAVVAVAVGSVFSHFPADLLMHDPDLALWPYSSSHVGLGLWTSFPVGSWFLEVGFIVVLALYSLRTHPDGWPALKYPLAILAFLALQMTPWWSPLQFVGASGSPLLYGAFVIMGFILPVVGIAYFSKASHI